MSKRLIPTSSLALRLRDWDAERKHFIADDLRITEDALLAMLKTDDTQYKIKDVNGVLVISVAGPPFAMVRGELNIDSAELRPGEFMPVDLAGPDSLE